MERLNRTFLGLVFVVIFGGFTPANAEPDTSAPTLDLFQLSRSSVDTGSSDRSLSLTAELSDPSGIRNASFYCDESVWFSLRPGDSSATIYFDSIAAVRTTASVSESGTSSSKRWVVTFTVPENRPAVTCNWRWAAQDLVGNNVNPLVSTGQTLQLIEGSTPPEAPETTGVEQYRGHGPDDGDFSAWTKLLANGTQMKFYAKYLQPGQKVQFLVQNSSGFYEQIAWKRVTEGDLADDGAYTNLQNHVYFIRTFDLKPGKNRVRILVDGEIVWGTKTYSLK